MQRYITFLQVLTTLRVSTNLIVVGATIFVLSALPTSAQIQDWVNSQPTPNPAPPIIDIAYPFGRVGVGILHPETMLHVHSLQQIAPSGNLLGTHYPAILRLQTQHNLGDAFTGIDGNKFGQSEIQFWSNSNYRPAIGINQFVPNKWQVSAIKSINLTDGSDPDLTQTNGIYNGGLAFYCSGSPTFTDAMQQIEVMRIVDKKVGVKASKPYANSLLDVRGTISSGGLDDVSNLRMPGTLTLLPKNNLDNIYHMDNYGVNFPSNPAITLGSQLRFSSGAIPGGGPLGSEGTIMVLESSGGSVGIGNHLTTLGGTMSNHALNLNGPKGTLSVLRNPDRQGVAQVAVRIEQAHTNYEYWWASPLISAGTQNRTSFEVFAGGQVHIGERDAANLNAAGLFGLMKWQKAVNGSMVPTNNPHTWDAKLVVKGKAVVQELFVTTTADYWADYVFDDNYELMPLEDVEHHIKANHHLPNIPSSQQICHDGGSSVGDMQVKLLQKVEELTLYMIELKKHTDDLQDRFTQLQREVEDTQKNKSSN